MGKLTLLFVLAAILGGSVLALSTRTLAGLTSRHQSEGQADLLARQIAESGQNLALTAMMDLDGFRDPAIAQRTYDGGRFEVDYAGAADRQTATVTVRGYYGGAVHTIESAYEFDPMAFPGPIWLDVPYATSTVSGTPEVAGGPDALPVRFDGRQHASLGIQNDFPVTGIDNDFRPDMTAAGSAFSRPAASAWAPDGPLLEDLNVDDAEGVYQAALAAMKAGDRTLAGNQTVTGARSWTGTTRITRVGGSLTVRPGGSVTGEGVLLVEGGLVVQAGGSLAWNGLVVVRAEQQVLPVTLSGTVNIAGALVVKQEALPPGGHLDVTVWRDANGLSRPQGAHQVAPWTSGGPFPWTQHNHRFDLTHGGSRTVYFVENGAAGRHETEMQFRAALAAAGATPVYLEFENEAAHGYARYVLNVQGEDPMTGAVRQGFPSDFHVAGNAHRSTAFRADRLRDLVLDVRSLRSLRSRFDNVGGCDSWPFCIGDNYDRRGALRVRLVRASDNKALYESALYWHMQPSEVAEHEAEMQAWRDAIAAGAGFGTHLTMGTDARVAFALAPLVRLAERLGFDGNEVNLLSTTTDHETTADARATGAPTTPATPAPTGLPATPPSVFPVTICHGGNLLSLSNTVAYLAHVAHLGDLLGACPPATTPAQPTVVPPPTTPSAPAACSDPNAMVTVCDTRGRTKSVRCRDLATHTGHGDTVGACSGGDDDDDEEDD